MGIRVSSGRWIWSNSKCQSRVLPTTANKTKQNFPWPRCRTAPVRIPASFENWATPPAWCAPARLPETALTLILNDDHLLVPIAGAPRSSAHVLEHNKAARECQSKLGKLIGCGHPSLMRVYRVCNCMAETQILGGQEFEDAATTWHGRRCAVLWGNRRIRHSSRNLFLLISG